MTLANSGVVRTACRKVGISRKIAYEHRDRDQAFAEEWETAEQDGLDLIEKSLIAKTRSSHPGAVTAAIFILKCKRPEVYRDKPIEHEFKTPLTLDMTFTQALQEMWDKRGKNGHSRREVQV